MSEPITFEQVARTATASWSIWGPNSGGGESLYLCQDVVHVVVYGDESPLPQGGEHVLRSLPAEVFVTSYAEADRYRHAVAGIRAALVSAARRGGAP
jgi:hypothetical protein